LVGLLRDVSVESKTGFLQVEIVKERVHQNFDQFNFGEQTQLQGEATDLRLRPSRKARHQSGGFFAAARWVDMLHEVQSLTIQNGFQTPLLTRCQGRNQV